MIKYFLVALAIWVLPTMSTPGDESGSESIPLELCDVNEFNFQAGEVLTYKIYYKVNVFNTAVGEVRFRVADRGNVLSLEAIGTTYSFYDMMFKVRDTVHTTLDKETLLPKYTRRAVHEGNYTGIDMVEYDFDRGVARSTKGSSLKDAEVKSIPLRNCTRDILSTIYTLRSIPIDDLARSKKLDVDLLLDRKNYPISVKYLGSSEERIKGMGVMKVHVVQPDLIASETFKDTEAMKVYVSADRNNVPLMIESPISVGRVRAVLSGYSGLKY